MSRRNANIMKPIASVVAVSESVEPASARSTTFVTAVNAVATKIQMTAARRGRRIAPEIPAKRNSSDQPWLSASVITVAMSVSAASWAAILRGSASGGRSNGVQL